MIAYARLTPGRGFRPRQAGLYYAQRLATLPRVRRAISWTIAACLKAKRGTPQPWEAGADHADVMAKLRREGLAVLEPLASDEAISNIITYFKAQPVVSDGGDETALDLRDRPATAAYSLQRVLDCPGLLQLLNAPPILRIASDYLGCEPTLSSVGVRWSFPTPASAVRTQHFHRDLDDWRFLKLFVYLTDVDMQSGPHCYVRTSHASAFGWAAKAYTQSELNRRFGADQITTVLGARGTTFIADTLGVHRGTAPVTRPRLILQAQYSLLPIYAFRYTPAAGASPPAAAYCNRLLLSAAPSPS